jgi:hypothetical protein
MAQVLTVPKLFVRAFWFDSYHTSTTDEFLETIKSSYQEELQAMWNRYLDSRIIHGTNDEQKIWNAYKRWIEVFKLADND